jgi:hypothetical protein
MNICPICGRQADLSALTSALTGEEGEGCITCSLANAEPLAAVYAAAKDDSSWHSIPKGIRQRVTVYEDGDYIPLKIWAPRMLTRCLVVVTKEEDDDELLSSAEWNILREILARNRPPPVRDRPWPEKVESPPTVLQAIVAMLP